MSLFNYSRKVDTKEAENVCVKCKKVFTIWSEYHAHITYNVCQRIKIVPERTTTRTKAQIVSDWEARQKPGAIIHV